MNPILSYFLKDQNACQGVTRAFGHDQLVYEFGFLFI